MDYIVKQLPAHLFWDSDLTKLDDVDHYEKIIVRTFERGDIEDIALVIAYYGNEICSEVLTKVNSLPERAIIFAANFLSIDKESFVASHSKQYYPL